MNNFETARIAKNTLLAWLDSGIYNREVWQAVITGLQAMDCPNMAESLQRRLNHIENITQEETIEQDIERRR